MNAARNIDLLGSLSLGQGDDDDDEGDGDEQPEVLHEGLGSFVSMLQPLSSSNPTSADARPISPGDDKGKGRRGGKKKKNKNTWNTNTNASASTSTSTSNAYAGKAKPHSRFANVPMFAELLELRDDDLDTWDVSPEIVMTQMNSNGVQSGTGGEAYAEHVEHRRRYLPADLETGWVALAPIPTGKRCLAVSHQHQGTASKYEGNSASARPSGASNILVHGFTSLFVPLLFNPSSVTNTHLHSRLKGTRLLKFPSGLPPDSIL